MGCEVGTFRSDEAGEDVDFGLSVMYGRYGTYFVKSAASLKDDNAPEIDGGGLVTLVASVSGFVGTYFPV